MYDFTNAHFQWNLNASPTALNVGSVTWPPTSNNTYNIIRIIKNGIPSYWLDKDLKILDTISTLTQPHSALIRAMLSGIVLPNDHFNPGTITGTGGDLFTLECILNRSYRAFIPIQLELPWDIPYVRDSLKSLTTAEEAALNFSTYKQSLPHLIPHLWMEYQNKARTVIPEWRVRYWSIHSYRATGKKITTHKTWAYKDTFIAFKPPLDISKEENIDEANLRFAKWVEELNMNEGNLETAIKIALGEVAAGVLIELIYDVVTWGQSPGPILAIVQRLLGYDVEFFSIQEILLWVGVAFAVFCILLFVLGDWSSYNYIRPSTLRLKVKDEYVPEFNDPVPKPSPIIGHNPIFYGTGI